MLVFDHKVSEEKIDEWTRNANHEKLVLNLNNTWSDVVYPLLQERDELLDVLDTLDSELLSALKVLYHTGSKNYVSLNYPKLYEKLEQEGSLI